MNLIQRPSPGSFLIYRCGDTFKLELGSIEKHLTPYLRTSLGGGDLQNEARIRRTEQDIVSPSNNWLDLPLTKQEDNTYSITLPLYQVGCFEAKVWFKQDNTDEALWIPGDNITIKVEPATTIANNSIYGVFTRQFGHNKTKDFALAEESATIAELDKKGYHVIPPSGTFRDVKAELGHIMDDMGFRIIQLLPIHTTPTTFGRMGRFGSPYAALDFFSVDSALAEFDKQATPLDQFIELVDEIHRRNGEVFLDIPVDHTGWASTLQQNNPEFFVRDNDGQFVSPGAWGTTWEDLVKLDFNNTDVHRMMADVFLFWCQKGVDGFRCDAGYMLPFDAWEYIIAKVRMQYPNTIFLLEGLGGPPEVTEKLLAKATFSWAYSELFQNYSKDELNYYVNNMLRISNQKGGLVNFSETHDNSRLAANSHQWSTMRNLLCALTAPAGAFGINNGVEFFAEEQVNVHNSSGLNWGNKETLIPLIKRITDLYKTHPAFLADAKIEVVPTDNQDLFSVRRTATKGETLVIVINLSCENEHIYNTDGQYQELLSGTSVNGQIKIAAASALCLDSSCKYTDDIINTSSDHASQMQTAKETLLAINAHVNGFAPITSDFVGEKLEQLLDSPPTLCQELGATFGQITHWDAATDHKRLVMVVTSGILHIHSMDNFSYALSDKGINLKSGAAIQKTDGSYFALVPICKNDSEDIKYLNLKVSCKTSTDTQHKYGKIALLPKGNSEFFRQEYTIKEVRERQLYGLCTNQRGGMAQVNGLWGRLDSKYDSFLAANLDQEVPVDRTSLISRFRCWVVYNDYSYELGEKSQISFAADGATQASWTFKTPTGQGKHLLLKIHLKMDDEKNAIALKFERLHNDQDKDLLDMSSAVNIIVRPDLEHRSNHEVTKAFQGAEALFAGKVKTKDNGFSFDPYGNAALNISAQSSSFISEPEWQYMHHLEVEAQRGLESATDLFSPGYFNFDLKGEESIILNAGVNKDIANAKGITDILAKAERKAVLKKSMQRFIVKRNEGQTVIAGYPWFLDWGRDTLICLRGIIAADMQQEARDILYTFAKYEEEGSLPNMIRGNNASNRDTSDAPLWFVVAVEDYMNHFEDASILEMDCDGRNIKEVISSIVQNYSKGTSNGIRMDEESGLIYSPSHFTWMDTNYPAGTPRMGYPIEIQSFWYAAVNFLSKIEKSIKWATLAQKIEDNVLKFYTLDDGKGLADCLHSEGYQSASKSIRDNACRCNQLFSVTLGLIKDKKLIESILTATQTLIIPGSIRSLKEAPVEPPLPVYRDGQLLNDPSKPYWGHYGGDEDTRRKPAYHNGTAWSWPFFSYSEALYKLTGDKANSLALLMSAKTYMESGIINQMPEISDGNIPHQQRGCLAQAWSITEFYRVLEIIN